VRVVIIQPHFLPFIGYFDLMNRADMFVYYDNVQFRRRSWHCRTWISEQNTAKWLSAPVSTANGSRVLLSEAMWVDRSKWRHKTVRRLQHCYAQTLQPDVLDVIADLFLSGPVSLSEWNILANNTLAALLRIKTTTIRSSLLPVSCGDKQQRIVQMCQEVGATKYLCGPGSRNYVSEAFFARAGIEVEWLAYNYEGSLATEDGHTVHPSILHPILLYGLDHVRQVISSNLLSISLSETLGRR
jgi:hypothetical protein